MSYLKQTFSTVDRTTLAKNICSTIAQMSDDITLTENELGIIIDNKFRLIFTPEPANVYQMYMTVSYGENTWDLSDSNRNGIQVNDYGIATRSTNVTIAVNSSSVNIKFKNYSTSDPYFNWDLLFVFSNNADIFIFSYNSQANQRPFATSLNFYNAATKSQEFTIVNRLPYVYSLGSTNIEMIEKKVFVIGNNRQAECSGLCDCSTVTGDQLFPINGKQYYAIDNNTLMEV